MTTKIQGFRFRTAELALADREAKRLKCAKGNVIRAALARIATHPLTVEEVAAVQLPGGMQSLSPKRRKSLLAKARAGKAAKKAAGSKNS